MPFYRLKTGLVHMRGPKLPPPCMAKVGIDDQQHFCLVWSEFLCDWPVGEGKTCDRPMCEAHAHQIGKNRHYCPDHFAESTNGQQRGLFTSLVQS